MALRRFELRNFRCFKEQSIELGPEANYFVGPNGSGKTSFLEAVFFLAQGRSFRNPERTALFRYGCSAFALCGEVDSAAAPVQLRLEVNGNDSLRLRIGEDRAKGFADIAPYMSVRVLDAGAHRLIEGAPSERRRFLDWGAFHVEPTFLKIWRSFQRTLQQRNSALKSHCTDAELDTWDVEFARVGVELNAGRQAYLTASLETLRQAVVELLGSDFDARLHPGWPQEESLRDCLLRERARDRLRATTGVGPHRAELKLRLGERPVRQRLSRGQQKLLTSALLIGQMHFASVAGASPGTLLIDDPAAELDVDNFNKLRRFLDRTAMQRLITLTHEPNVKDSENMRLFHVEQGKIS